MKKILSLALLLVVCSGCSGFDQAQKVAREQFGIRDSVRIDCGDLLAQALTSPDKVVPGAIACLSGRFHQIAIENGIHTDGDVRGYAAQDPVYKLTQKCSVKDVKYRVYLLRGPDGPAALLERMDGRLVDGFKTYDGVDHCPEL